MFPFLNSLFFLFFENLEAQPISVMQASAQSNLDSTSSITWLGVLNTGVANFGRLRVAIIVACWPSRTFSCIPRDSELRDSKFGRRRSGETSYDFATEFLGCVNDDLLEDVARPHSCLTFAVLALSC